MVLQGGWFISPEGETHEVLEHFAFVKANPALFGLSKKQTAGWTRKDRDRALRLVLSGGWIRVRDGTFETSSLTSTAVRNIRGFLKQIKAWRQDSIRVTEHRDAIVLRTTAALFLGKESAVFAYKKKLLENAAHTVRNIRTMSTNPFTSPTVVPGRGIFVPTGPPVVCSGEGDVEIDVPASPTVLPGGRVFVPTAPPGGAWIVRGGKVFPPTAPTRRQKPKPGVTAAQVRKVARTAPPQGGRPGRKGKRVGAGGGE
ncbi:MAG: hypothetical protein RDV41_14850 [Planctomycetota bacterium]|nr:hypothetical protein [Planctomycetota bacterium]